MISTAFVYSNKKNR